MSKTRKVIESAPQQDAEQDGGHLEIDTESSESSKPDYVLKQYRTIRTGKGMVTRLETIGVAWRNAATGMLTHRYNGVQVISNDVFAFPIAYDFNQQPQ